MSWLSSLFGRGRHGEEYPVDNTFNTLRSQVLKIRAEDLGLDGQADAPLALLMEMGTAKAVVTLAAVADGTTSLYFSNGGGIIGAGGYDEVRAANAAFLAAGKTFLPHLSPTLEFPFPARGRIRFYLVFPGRVLTAEASEQDLKEKRHPLAPLFYTAHRVIGAIRLRSPG